MLKASHALGYVEEPRLAILIDPSNPEGAKKIYQECRRNRDLVNEKCQMWVGCTKSGWRDVGYWIKLCKDAGFETIVCYPGKVRHSFSARYATHLFRPELLNPYSDVRVKNAVRMGKFLSNLIYMRRDYPRFIDSGYLVLYRESSVGRKTIRPSAPDVTDEEALVEVERYLRRDKKAVSIYTEAGSGAKRAVLGRIPLIKDIDRIIGDRTSIAGGGIELDWEIEKLLDAGVDVPVVGTHFEDEPEDITAFIKRI